MTYAIAGFAVLKMVAVKILDWDTSSLLAVRSNYRLFTNNMMKVLFYGISDLFGMSVAVQPPSLP